MTTGSEEWDVVMMWDGKKSRPKHHDAHLGFSLRATLHTKKISNV
jgi:hypothetical protein